MFKYKTQGKAHIVYDKYPNILRIPKIQKGQEEYVLKFHEIVINRLLGEKYYSSLEITSLVDKGLEMDGFGLLQSDYTVSLCSTKVLTLEIKPKYAITNGSICDFCCHSYLKHTRGEKEFISDFCPFDLYSLEPTRMIRALRALYSFSRLKIFYNGIIQNNEITILNMYTGLDEYFKDIVQILIQDGILIKLNESHLHARNIPLRNFKENIIQHQNVDRLLKSLESFRESDSLKDSSSYNKFLISKSLMDVSIMIRIENKYSKGCEKIGKYYYTIGVIDVQPKDIEKLQQYSQTEQEIRKVCGIRHCPIF